VKDVSQERGNVIATFINADRHSSSGQQLVMGEGILSDPEDTENHYSI